MNHANNARKSAFFNSLLEACMVNKSIAISICALGLIACTYFIGRSFSQQDIEPNACDALAAHPGDPQKKGAGVPIDKIPAESAIAECQRAAAQYPKAGRFRYQLGRALEAGKNHDAAFSTFVAASQMGYVMADHNLGIRLSASREYDRAREHFRKAAEGGVAVAKKELDSFDFSTEGFIARDVLAGLYEGPSSKSLSRDAILYVLQFTDRFNSTCGALNLNVAVKHATRLATGKLLGNFWGSAGAIEGNRGYASREDAAITGMTLGAVVAANAQQQADYANRDAQTFYGRYNCTSPVADRFFKNLKAWILSL